MEADIERYNVGALTLAQLLCSLRDHTRALEEIAGITEAGVCDSCHAFFPSLMRYKGVVLCPSCCRFATSPTVQS